MCTLKTFPFPVCMHSDVRSNSSRTCILRPQTVVFLPDAMCVSKVSFSNLRAEGAFLVSARAVSDTTSESVTLLNATIESTLGGTCAVKEPTCMHAKHMCISTGDGTAVPTTVINASTRILAFETLRATTYIVHQCAQQHT